MVAVVLALIGPAELVVVAILLVAMALPIWSIFHAARAPDTAWDAIGQSRAVWVALLAVGWVLTPVGGLLALVYLATVRPRLHRAALGR